MKHPYFTSETIQEKAREMLLDVADYQRGSLAKFTPEKSALLVLDMQLYFLEPTSHAYIPSAAAILPGIRELAGAYTALRLPVFYTQHVNTLQNAGSMRRWWRELITSESPLSDITADLNTDGAVIVQKTQYDAFFQTALEDLLLERGVSQVIICGVMTHLCCETTARSAFVRGFEVFFCIDGTATYTEELHRASLLTLSHGFATPVLVSHILSQLSNPDENH